MSDPTPAQNRTHGPEQPSEAPEPTPTPDGAREALVERLAEAMLSGIRHYMGLPGADVVWNFSLVKAARIQAEEVAPLVAAEVEAAVSVVRAERDEIQRLCLSWMASGNTAPELLASEVVRRKSAESEMHARELHHFETEQENAALREKVARVEALRDEWVAWTPGVVVAPSALASAYERGIQACVESLTTALSEPTTPDRALLAPSPAEGTGETDPSDCYCPDDHASWCPNLRPRTAPCIECGKGLLQGGLCDDCAPAPVSSGEASGLYCAESYDVPTGRRMGRQGAVGIAAARRLVHSLNAEAEDGSTIRYRVRSLTPTHNHATRNGNPTPEVKPPGVCGACDAARPAPVSSGEAHCTRHTEHERGCLWCDIAAEQLSRATRRAPAATPSTEEEP